jgi:hypothetical protein
MNDSMNHPAVRGRSIAPQHGNGILGKNVVASMAKVGSIWAQNETELIFRYVPNTFDAQLQRFVAEDQ